MHNISDFTVKIIPVLSALYIAASLYIIIINGSRDVYKRQIINTPTFGSKGFPFYTFMFK